LLFSDFLIWLASAEKGDGDLEDWNWRADPNKDKRKSLGLTSSGGKPIARSRRRSEAELSALKTSKAKDSDSDLAISSPSDSKSRSLATPKKKIRHASSSAEEKWVYKGKVDLVDLEVVVSRPMEDGEERRFEVLSPETSFVLYACEFKELL
jgi:hypothetical protein